MQDLSENTKLKRYLFLMFSVAACGIFDFSDIIREYLELVPFPNQEFQLNVIGVLIIDFILCNVIEKVIMTRYLATFI